MGGTIVSNMGKRIRAIREARELSLNELARRAGVGAASVSRLENEQQGVNVDTLAALCKGLGLSLAEFFGADVAALPRGVRIPLLCVQQVQNYLENHDTMDVPMIDIPEKPGAGNCLALKINDVSMQGQRDYFAPGDVVIIDPAVRPQPGEYVLARADGQTIFRQYKLRQDHIELAPLNPFWPTVAASPDDVLLIGTMVEHRRYRRAEESPPLSDALQK